MNKYVSHTDSALMQAIAQRDEQAFAELYRRYGQRMFRFFYRMLWQDAGRAEDFTQELFVKIIERPEGYHPARPFVTWLYALAYNLCKNEYRRQARAASHFAKIIPPDETIHMSDPVDQQLLEAQLRAWIDALPPAHRQCFVLRFQEELSVQEIAEIVGCPEGTVKSRLHYAVQKLTAGIQGVWGKNVRPDLYKNLVIKHL